MMLDILKKTLFVGLGATVISAEKLRSKLDELVDKGKISAKEAQDMTGKIMEEGKKEFAESESKISNMVDELMNKAGFAPKSELNALSARVDALEKEAAKPEEASAK